MTLRRRFLISILAVLLMAGAAWATLAWLRPAGAGDSYSVVDGDTLELRPEDCLLSHLGIACISQRLRLFGVDAFESTQTCRNDKGALWPCGALATERLRQLVAGPDFSCHVDPEFVDRHAREFAACSSGGCDVGAILVSEGLAFAYGRGAQYLANEAEAKQRRRGAWAGSFVRPQFFRQGAVE